MRKRLTASLELEAFQKSEDIGKLQKSLWKMGLECQLPGKLGHPLEHLRFELHARKEEQAHLEQCVQALRSSVMEQREEVQRKGEIAMELACQLSKSKLCADDPLLQADPKVTCISQSSPEVIAD